MPPETVLQIAGIVHEKGKVARPIADAQVTIVERGQSVTTDRFGRYSVRNVPAGDYTVQVSAQGRTAKHKLTIPTGTPDLSMYDLSI
jgi:hypothetical protein